MGVPTTTLPDSSNIGTLQSLPRGERFYRGGLGNAGGYGNPTNQPAIQHRIWQQQPAATAHNRPPIAPSHRKRPPTLGRNASSGSNEDGNALASMLSRGQEAPQPKGVAELRVKKRLRNKVLDPNATPGTKASATRVLTDLARGETTAATDAIRDAEDDESITESQDIATMAIQLSKLETDNAGS